MRSDNSVLISARWVVPVEPDGVVLEQHSVAVLDGAIHAVLPTTEALEAYLERSPLTHIHAFPYSDRPGTPAAAMAGKVNGVVVRERGRRIRDIGRMLTERFRDSQVGTIHRALTLEDGSRAVTGNYLKVRIPPGHRRNEWVRLRLTSQDDGELLAG